MSTEFELESMLSSTSSDADPDPAVHFDSEPYPTFHFDTDPDPTYHFDADPDPDHISKYRLKTLKKCSSRLIFNRVHFGVSSAN